MNTRLLTSESVTEGHPDKVCDQIADAILDAYLEQDCMSRVACEVACTTDMVLVMGEITSTATVDIPAIVRKTIREIGYTEPDTGFDADSCEIITRIDTQSPDIDLGVSNSIESKTSDNNAWSLGAGDQGMMFGYASKETPEFLPLPLVLAHRLTRQLAKVRKDGILPYLRPDGKAQVTVEYNEQGQPIHIDTVIVSAQHSPDVTEATLYRDIRKHVIDPVLCSECADAYTKYLINPTGRFVVGGPHGDSGVTGRKLIVDTYGGFAHHGGGAFSGKDCTKVDRSAAYMARYLSKNMVAAGLAEQCEIQLSYAIGVAEPLSIVVDTFGTGTVPDSVLASMLRERFDLRPSSMIERFDLRRPIYQQTASYGHFGRNDLDLPWERLDCTDSLRNLF